MTITIARPERAARPTGLLGYDKFQTAYVTTDLDRAVDTLRSAYKIENWTLLDVGVMRIGLAWINGQQIEIIETFGDHQPLYDDWIDKAGEFSIRQHHFGYYIYDNTEWILLRQQLAQDGRPLLMDVDTGALKIIYVYAAELGHFLEYIFPNEQGKAFFESVAAN